MNAALVWPGAGNPGDAVIKEGCARLLESAGACPVLFQWNDHTKNDPPDFNGMDAVAFAGTPWVFDQFHKSKKFENGLAMVKAAGSRPVLWLGVGSALVTDAGSGRPSDGGIMYRPGEADGIRRLFGHAALVACRDDWAYGAMVSAFNGAGQKPRGCGRFACPSWFWGGAPKNASALLAFHDPEDGINKGTAKAHREQALAAYRIFVRDYRPEVLLYDKDVKGWARFLDSLPKEERAAARRLPVFETTDLLDFRFHAYRMCLSGRVHVAVPAELAGCRTALVGFDTRDAVFSSGGGFVARTAAEALKWLAAVDRRAKWEHLLRAVEAALK
jgi:hypothetical protein